MVTLEALRRKARFRAALVAAGLTQKAWADAEGVTYGHLYEVLHGKRHSVPLTAKIEAFAEKWDGVVGRAA